MRFAVLLAPLVLVGSLAAQTTITPGETFELPNFNVGAADHAALAVNDRGDVFLVWHVDRPDLSGDVKQVEGALFRYVSSGVYETPGPGYNHFLLGDPTVPVLSSGFETCRKPDVCSVGDDFVVTWPRTPAGQDATVLEAVLVRPGAGGQATVEAPAAGTGYLIDGNLSRGTAGAMPDLTGSDAEPGVAFLAYAHADQTSGQYREFDIRYARIDFCTLPPTLAGPYTIVNDLPFDDAQGIGGPAGGKVLPDIVLDDFGNLVLAYEAYEMAGHFGGGPDEGWIGVERFALGAGPPVLLDATRVQGVDPAEWHRRPNLDATRTDSSNTVGLVWMESQVPANSDVDARHFTLDFRGGPSPGAITFTDLAYPNETTVDDGLPAVVHGRFLDVCVTSEGQQGSSQLMAWAPGNLRNLVRLTTPSAPPPWRPAADLLEIPMGPGRPRYLLPLSYEAFDASSELEIYFVFYLK